MQWQYFKLLNPHARTATTLITQTDVIPGNYGLLRCSPDLLFSFMVMSQSGHDGSGVTSRNPNTQTAQTPNNQTVLTSVWYQHPVLSAVTHHSVSQHTVYRPNDAIGLKQMYVLLTAKVCQSTLPTFFQIILCIFLEQKMQISTNRGRCFSLGFCLLSNPNGWNYLYGKMSRKKEMLSKQHQQQQTQAGSCDILSLTCHDI